MKSSLPKYARLAALKPVARAMPVVERTHPPEAEDELAQLLGASVQKTHFGEHLSIRNWYSTPEFVEPAAAVLGLLTRGARRSGNVKSPLGEKEQEALEDPEKWLFLDTETTGLAGGTGTYAFLVGIAWWDAGGLQMEQFFMRDFAEEHSVLCELAERVTERPVLVTFNGKTFDWPLLESRFTMTRKIAAPRLSAHLDLLHPARALWKLRLGSVRLVELEKHVLEAPKMGWHREDDVSSSLIPQFYFDYLRGGSAAPLGGVIRHNQMDLRGLAALFGKINALLAEEHTASEDGRDLFGLSRFLQRRGEDVRAATSCTRALDAGLPAEHRHEALRELALLAKRRGEHHLAAELWQKVLQDSRNGMEACEQLAIHFERQERDLLRAKEFTQLGLTKLRTGGLRLRDPYTDARVTRQENGLLRRLARLEQRIAKGQGRMKLHRAAAAGRLL